MKLIEAINIFYEFLEKTKDKDAALLTEDFKKAREILNNFDPKITQALAQEVFKK